MKKLKNISFNIILIIILASSIVFSNNLKSINEDEILEIKYESINIEDVNELGRFIFLDENNAWVGLCRTKDGGLTWERMILTKEVAKKFYFSEVLQMKFEEVKDLYYFQWLRDLYFISKDIGWWQPIEKDAHGLWKTEDGGNTWKRIGDDYIAEFYSIDNQNAWLLLVDKKRDAYVSFITNDGGKSFIECKDSNDFFEKSRIEVVYFLDKNNGWAIGYCYNKKEKANYCILKTNDGGCNWNFLSELAEGYYGNSEIYFLDQRNGWITNIEFNYILNSNDGGKNWDKINLKNFSVIPWSVFFISEKEGWLLSWDLDFFYTNDGGKLWKKLKTEEILAGFPKNKNGKEWGRGNVARMLIKGRIYNYLKSIYYLIK